jgi:hypothetical protein
MRLKHGSRWRTELTSTEDGSLIASDEGEVGADEIVSQEFYSLLYNAAGVSGGILWRHPTRGTLYPGGVRYRLVVPVDPTDELTDDQLCDCARCLTEEEEEAS